MTETRGVRAIPPALLLAFAGWLGLSLVRTAYWVTASEPWRAIRLNMMGEGIGFMCEVLAIVGTVELARRLTGRLALGMRVAAAGFIAMLCIDLAYSFVNFMERVYDHEWIFKATSYGYWIVWLAVPVGFAIALWQERRGFAIALVVASLLLYPPEPVAKHLFSWLPNGKAGFAIDGVLRLIRLGLLVAGLWFTARGVPIRNRAPAAAGMRSAAYAMWLRIIATIGVPLLTLMTVGGRGGPDAFRMLKVAAFGALVINIIALVQFGRGALRAASANVGELGRWNLAVGGAGAMWSAGVWLAQLSWFYKVAFGSSSDFLGSEGIEYVEALGLTVPLVAIGGVALAAIAIGGLAARIGNDQLRALAQSRGAAFVILSLTSAAITMWGVPKARFESSAIMMVLVATGAMLVALVMIARLFNDAADELESEPGLPPAAVVSDAT